MSISSDDGLGSFGNGALPETMLIKIPQQHIASLHLNNSFGPSLMPNKKKLLKDCYICGLPPIARKNQRVLTGVPYSMPILEKFTM